MRGGSGILSRCETPSVPSAYSSIHRQSLLTPGESAANPWRYLVVFVCYLTHRVIYYTMVCYLTTTNHLRCRRSRNLTTPIPMPPPASFYIVCTSAGSGIFIRGRYESTRDDRQSESDLRSRKLESRPFCYGLLFAPAAGKSWQKDRISINELQTDNLWIAWLATDFGIKSTKNLKKIKSYRRPV